MAREHASTLPENGQSRAYLIPGTARTVPGSCDIYITTVVGCKFSVGKLVGEY